MADFIPVRARFTGLDVTALQEFEPTDTIALSIISGFSAGVTTELDNNSISALGDVDTSGVGVGEVLTYAGSPPQWIAAPTHGVTDHTLLTNIGTNTHAQIDTHIADGTIHYSDAPADAQDYVRNNNTWVVATSATFGEYIGPFDASGGSFPTTSNQGDWFNVTVAGTVDGQSFIVGDILIALVDSPSTSTFAGNWTVVPNVSITDHTLLTNIGTNTHAQIDTHISDGTVHFTQASISITESQISDLQNYSLVGHTHPISDVINLQTALDTKVETASNLGTGAGVFAQKVAQDLEFKTLVPGDGVQITPSASEILIEARRDKFFAHNGPVTQTFTTGLITVLFPTVVRSDAAFTYSAGDVTINTAGWYFIEYQLSADNTGNSRAGSETGITINSLVVVQPGSLGYAYHRNSSTGKGSFTGRILVQLAVNDVIRVRTHRDGGGSTLETLPDGCRLTIVSTGAP